ncbi:hypothetical protein IE81DRAFT_339222 [Ceraceosorus guamensis]|uniref:Major facilitator superfamily (MFS) profile domain-containing protein n=1 Tax=Ceraceosorus guamensis TaxID=1522189 RepID=A0A316W753_9BASI|nr:hypothetical protein IE81DRAFT_339222 [Ceraceosorus guamensis]PWN45642.1 hypothetical protein IE81DRAFT_339222 [Ceraceosorus guamensis]
MTLNGAAQGDDGHRPRYPEQSSSDYDQAQRGISTQRYSHESYRSDTSLVGAGADGSGSRRRIKVPDLSTDAAGASPLSKLGIQGDALMMFVTCFSAMGVLLMGYDQGVMSGIITGPYFKTYFNHPTSYEIGTMVAILEIGAFITSLACGTLADVLGRKKLIFWGALIFSIGGAIQTFTVGFKSMVLGRIIAGFGVGALTMVVPTYQSEVSPAENRGKLACIEFTCNIIGYCLSVWIDYFCSFLTGDISWRAPLFFQVAVGLILAFGSLTLPESPRWLLDRDRDVQGMRVLADLHGNGNPKASRARLEYREIKENVLFLREQGDRSYKAMWRRYKRRTLIGCSAQACAQLNGINVVSYYAPLVFESAGWVGRDAILMTGINGIIYVCCTIPTWFLIDRVGRRPILMLGSIICGLALCACGYFLWLDANYTPTAVVACIIIFNGVFGSGWGPIPWMLSSEIMPLAFRAKAASLSTATNWAFNYVVGEATPILQETIKWRLYPMHGFLCFASFFLVFFTYPETMGVPLEEMDALFNDEPSGVPQDDDDDDEDEPSRTSVAGEEARRDSGDLPERQIRRSISSHRRFTSGDDEESVARAAAQRVQSMRTTNKNEESARGTYGAALPNWVRKIWNSSPGEQHYAPVGSEEDQ